VAGFHFNLERVLRWRSLQLAAEQAKLDRIVAEQLRLRSLQAALSSEKSKLVTSLGVMPDLRGEDFRVAASYSKSLQRQNERLAESIAQCEKVLAEQRVKYRAAKQRFRLLEELKQRRLEEWRYAQACELESLASESYLANWNRS
jgi:hypothetical protein